MELHIYVWRELESVSVEHEMTTFDTTRVGDKVRSLFDEPGRGSQSDLARLLQISQPAVNRWRKNNGDPDQIYWPLIEQFFELDPGTLLAVALGVDNDSHTGRVADLLEQATALLHDGLAQKDRDAVTKLVKSLRHHPDTLK